MALLLTPETIRTVALVLLNGALTAYLLRVPGRATAARWLAGFTAGTVGLYLCRAVEASVFPQTETFGWALKSVELVIVMAALLALVQFAYRFLGMPFPREARALLWVGGLAVAGSVALAVAVRGAEGVRDLLMAPYSIAWTLADAWAALVLFRKRRIARAEGDDRAARAFGAFALVCLADLAILVVIVVQLALIPPSAGGVQLWPFVILPAIFAVHYARVAVYITHAPEPTSLRAKLVGLGLAMVLAIVGMAAVLIEPGDPNQLAALAAQDPEVYREVHRQMLPLLALLLAAAAFALVAFPLALRGSLVEPVERLLGAVRRVNAGEREVSVPLGVRDEIGRLSEGFNGMTRSLASAEAELRAYAGELENRVTERTAELAERTAEVEEQARQLEELDRLKTRLFANLSHEFRTPLTLLLGPIEDALEGRTDDLTPHLPTMRHNARRLLGLVNQLLDLAKLEAGAMVLRREDADLAALARGVSAAFAGQAEREGIGLLFDAPAGGLAASVDAGQIETVLTNLLANALAFTDRGGKVRVVVAREGTEAVLSVEDTGRGIPADAIPHVFDRFRQADESATRTHGGTGIGLALTKELTELHGGTIGVESAAGFGTRFTVRLPLTDAPQLAPVSEPEALATPSPAPAEGDRQPDEPVPSPEDDRPLVLIVEDHADLRAFVRGHLAERYRVVEAADGRAGLETARAHRPNLVLSDVMMPEMDGVALTRALKADPALSDVPVVLLTAWADEASTLGGLAAGADDYLAKPFSPGELLARVDNFITARRRLRERYSDEVVVGPSEIVVPSAEAAFLQRVRDVAEAHLAEPDFGVDALAAEVGLSRRQLGRRLRAALDTSPGAFLRELRLQRAAQLLEQEAGTVAEVAYAVGYRDPDHFSKQFRKAYDVTPSGYPTP